MTEFDKIIREKLYNSTASYDEKTWEAIADKIPTKRRRPLGFYIALFGLPLLLGVIFTSLPNKNKITNKAEIKSGLNESLNDNFALEQATSPSKSIHLPPTEKVILPESINEVENIIFENNIPKTSPHYKDTDIKIESKIVENSFSVNENIAEVTSNVQSSIVESEINLPSNKIFRPTIKLVNLQPSNRFLGTDRSQILENASISMKRYQMLLCPTFLKKEDYSYIELFYNADYPIRTLSPKIKGSNDEYLNIRNKTENPYLSFSTGFRIGIGWENGITAKTGISYAQVNEKFTHTDFSTIQTKERKIIEYVKDANQNIIDSTFKITIDTIQGAKITTSYNKYRFIDLPLLFEYTLAGSGRFSYTITAGPLVNLSFSHDGLILDENGNEIIDLNKNDLYTSNIGISFYGSFGLNYNIGSKSVLTIEPGFRYVPTNLTTLNNLHTQSYFIPSLGASVKYKI